LGYSWGKVAGVWHLVLRLKEEYSYTFTPLLGLHGLFKGEPNSPFSYCVGKWIVLVVPQAVKFAFVVRIFARNISSNLTSKLTSYIKRNLYVVVCPL